MKTRKSGFTLMELMIVLAIIGIVVFVMSDPMKSEMGASEAVATDAAWTFVATEGAHMKPHDVHDGAKPQKEPDIADLLGEKPSLAGLPNVQKYLNNNPVGDSVELQEKMLDWLNDGTLTREELEKRAANEMHGTGPCLDMIRGGAWQ